jgi:hypothetical protein
VDPFFFWALALSPLILLVITASMGDGAEGTQSFVMVFAIVLVGVLLWGAASGRGAPVLWCSVLSTLCSGALATTMERRTMAWVNAAVNAGCLAAWIVLMATNRVSFTFDASTVTWP